MMWIVGKYKGFYPEGVVWDIVGVFLTRQMAVKACEDHFDYFVGPIALNRALPEKSTTWPGCFYPATSELRVLQGIGKWDREEFRKRTGR
jgi:hypothetical protein